MYWECKMRHSTFGYRAPKQQQLSAASPVVEQPKPEVPRISQDAVAPTQQQATSTRYEPVPDAALPEPAERSAFLLVPAGEDVAQPVETIDAGDSYKLPGGWKLTTSLAGVSFSKGDAPSGSETKRSGSIELEIASGTKLIIAYAVATGEAATAQTVAEAGMGDANSAEQIGSSVDVGSAMGESSNG